MGSYKSSFVCPVCGRGVLTKNDFNGYDMSFRDTFILPSCQVPHCTNCSRRFEIKITPELLIEIREIYTYSTGDKI